MPVAHFDECYLECDVDEEVKKAKKAQIDLNKLIKEASVDTANTKKGEAMVYHLII